MSDGYEACEVGTYLLCCQAVKPFSLCLRKKLALGSLPATANDLGKGRVDPTRDKRWFRSPFRGGLAMRRIMIAMVVLVTVGLLAADQASAGCRRRARRCCEPCCVSSCCNSCNSCSSCNSCCQPTNCCQPGVHHEGTPHEGMHHEGMQHQKPTMAPEVPKSPPPAPMNVK